MFSGFGGFGKKDDDNVVKSINDLSNSAKPIDNKSLHGFDPSALERAAKAARELDSSKNSRHAIELIQTQEATKQKELELQRARYMAEQQQLAIQRVQEEEKAASRTLERQSQHDKLRNEHRDELERKRMVDQINAKRQLQDEEIRKQEDSLRRQEEIKRKTLDYEAELKQRIEIARVKEEAIGRIKQERDNHDLIIERKKLELLEYRNTMIESIKVASTTIGKGLQEFITDKQKLSNFTLTITMLAFGIYTAKISTNVIGKFIETRLGKPSLVRETSRSNIIQNIRHPIRYITNASKKSDNSIFGNIVLLPTLESRLKRIATSTYNTKVNKAPYRHLLLYGPPGTGKTMFAKGLAKESNMHYAIMTGGDIAPLGKDAVTEIHKLFDWANTTSKGVIIFVDEADAFLRKRNTEKISEDMRNALNAFLYRTGETSKKFMIVYASNQPEQFDWAINDRIDELIPFDLPSYNERYRMIKQYINEYLINSRNSARVITVVGLDDSLIDYFTKETDGFSGREISKLAIAWQAAAYGNANAIIDDVLMKQVLNDSKASKIQKELWLKNEINKIN